MDRRLIMTIVIALCTAIGLCGQSRTPIVADSLTRQPLQNASIFDRKGKIIGLSNSKGAVYCASPADYPLTIRYLGFNEKRIDYNAADTILLTENISELPEVVVASRQRKMLHILAYSREYSTLSSYTDTVTMFREKMVDFMLPAEKKDKGKGWRYPRVLNARSYYQFTNCRGLDSVSDRCNYHFSWSDWIGILPTFKVPCNLENRDFATDTVFGKYSPAEIWIKDDDRLRLDIDVLADTASRKWVPNISSFFRNDNLDFEQFRMKLNYSNVVSNEISPIDLTAYSFNIDSRGRGHNMFMFNRHDQPFFVTTYTEVYILDKEYITLKEARKWEDKKFDTSLIEIYEPTDAPELQPDILALIDRVNNIDADRIRLTITPDKRLMSRNVRRGNFSIGNRALNLLKQLTGISFSKSRKNFNSNWNDLRNRKRKKKNSPK